jgi:hypothetical protein
MLEETQRQGFDSFQLLLSCVIGSLSSLKQAAWLGESSPKETRAFGEAMKLHPEVLNSASVDDVVQSLIEIINQLKNRANWGYRLS